MKSIVPRLILHGLKLFFDEAKRLLFLVRQIFEGVVDMLHDLLGLRIQSALELFGRDPCRFNNLWFAMMQIFGLIIL
jgi:hypothetical protein